jgi:hypothetical protein
MRLAAGFAVLVFFASLPGCSSLHFNPVTSLSRAVYPVGELQSSITVVKAHRFFDSKSKVYSVTIVPGVYVLDAQDGDYWYYRAPVALQRAIYESDNSARPDFFPGGIAIGKRKNMIFPAAVYKSDGSLDRIILWRFGSEFHKVEGTVWKRDDHACDPK